MVDGSWVVAITSEGEEDELGVFRAPLARLKAGEGDVARFPTLESAEEWAEDGEDLDTSLFDVAYIWIRG